MKWFRKQTAPAGASVQLRETGHHPFGLLGQYVPMRSGEIRLYRAVREAVPVVDAAIYKLIRMVGGVTAACSDPAAERGLGEFLRTVPAGRGQYGVNAFLEGYLDALLPCGRAIGEIVPAAGNREIAAVLWGRVEDIEIREGDHPLAFTICGPDEQGRMGPLPCQDLLLFTPLNPAADSPYGVSLLRGLPFLTDILMKIYHTIGINWERCGSLRFAVTCRDGGNGQAEERSRMLSGEWSRAMQDTRSGSVRDFVAVGDVDIQVIGADAPVLDSEVPVRQILEQLVARTGIPPFLLGLSWSSTERMSSQQADIMTSELAALRRAIIASLQSHISTLEIQLNNIRREESLARTRIASAPRQSTELLDNTRQQRRVLAGMGDSPVLRCLCAASADNVIGFFECFLVMICNSGMYSERAFFVMM